VFKVERNANMQNTFTFTLFCLFFSDMISRANKSVGNGKGHAGP